VEAMTPHPRVWMGVSLFRLGRWDEALACCEAGVAALGDLREDPPGFAAALYLVPAMIQHLRGDEVAIEKGRDAIGRIRAHRRGYPWQLRWAVNTGRPDRALRMLDNPPPGWQVTAGPTWEARCDASWSGVPVDEAAEAATMAAAEARRIGSPATSAHALRLAGIVAWRSGALDEGRSALDEAIVQFAELGSRFEQARTQLARAALADVMRDEEASTAMRAEGRAVYDELRVAHDPMLDQLPSAAGMAQD